MELSFTMLYGRNVVGRIYVIFSLIILFDYFCAGSNLTWHYMATSTHSPALPWLATIFCVVHLSLSGNKMVSILWRGQVGGCNGVIYFSCHRNISLWLGSYTHQATQIEPFIKSQSMWHYWPWSLLTGFLSSPARFIIQYVKSTMTQNARVIQL